MSKGPRGKWRDVRDKMLKMCRAHRLYPGRDVLAAELDSCLSTINRAIGSSAKLLAWRAKAPHYSGPRGKWRAIRERLLEICRTGRPYQGDEVLATDLGCSPSVIQKAIRSSDELRAWRAEANLPSVVKRTWPAIRDKLLEMCRADRSYPGPKILTAELHCAFQTVKRAIESSRELTIWAGKIIVPLSPNMPANVAVGKHDGRVFGMICPACGACHSKVTWTRHRLGRTVRRRQCQDCGLRFGTQERIRPGTTYTRGPPGRRSKLTDKEVTAIDSRIRRLAQVLATMTKHPAWSIRRISRETGVPESTLRLWPEVKTLQENLAGNPPPRGHKTRDGKIEAYD